MGRIVDSSNRSTNKTQIDTIPKAAEGEELIRIQNNVINFYSHIVYVQNVFMVEVEVEAAIEWGAVVETSDRSLKVNNKGVVYN